MDIKEKWNKFLKKMNMEGLTLLFIKDPKTGKSSVSLTMLLISFVLVILGILNKENSSFNIDVNQALSLFYACSALYFGRKFSSGESSIEIKNQEKSQE